jgi:hypothetical protein
MAVEALKKNQIKQAAMGKKNGTHGKDTKMHTTVKPGNLQGRNTQKT